jgi:hypothetical protein
LLTNDRFKVDPPRVELGIKYASGTKGCFPLSPALFRFVDVSDLFTNPLDFAAIGQNRAFLVLM